MKSPVAPPSSAFYVHLAERVVWTAVQAGLGVLTVYLADVPAVFAPLIASVLAVVKGYVARRVGDEQSPAMLPGGV